MIPNTMKQFTNPTYTRLQGAMAIACFVAGVLVATICLFFIEPLGSITYSATGIVSELLLLCGALLGVKASIDTRFREIRQELAHKADKPE